MFVKITRRVLHADIIRFSLKGCDLKTSEGFKLISQVKRVCGEVWQLWLYMLNLPWFTFRKYINEIYQWAGFHPARLSLVYRMCYFATMSGTFVWEEGSNSSMRALYLYYRYIIIITIIWMTVTLPQIFLYESAVLAAFGPLHALLISPQHHLFREISLGGKT